MCWEICLASNRCFPIDLQVGCAISAPCRDILTSSPSTVPFTTVHTVANGRPPFPVSAGLQTVTGRCHSFDPIPFVEGPVFDSQLPPPDPHALVSTGCVSRTQKDRPCAVALAIALTVSRACQPGQPGQPALSGKALTLQPTSTHAPCLLVGTSSTPHSKDIRRYLLSLLHARPALACANRQLHLDPQCVPTPIASPSEALHCIASNRILACRRRSTHRPRSSIIQTLCLPRSALPDPASPFLSILFSFSVFCFPSILFPRANACLGHSSQAGTRPSHPHLYPPTHPSCVHDDNHSYPRVPTPLGPRATPTPLSSCLANPPPGRYGFSTLRLWALAAPIRCHEPVDRRLQDREGQLRLCLCWNPQGQRLAPSVVSCVAACPFGRATAIFVLVVAGSWVTVSPFARFPSFAKAVG